MIPLQASVTCIQNTLLVNLKNTTKEEISAVSIDLEEQYDKFYRCCYYKLHHFIHMQIQIVHTCPPVNKYP